MPYSVALCGLGAVSRFQCHALDRLESRFRVVAVCDPDPARWAAAPTDRCFPSLAALLADLTPDAVVVSTPNETHFHMALVALQAGLPVLLEKPAVTRLADFDALSAAADASGVALHTALHAMLAPDVQWLAAHRDRLVRAHGPIRTFSSVYCDPYFHDGLDPPLLARALSLGGCWEDSGVNALSALWPLLDGIHVERVRRTERAGISVQSLAHLGFAVPGSPASGRGVIEIDWCRGHNRKTTHLAFSDGSELRMEHNAHRVIRPGPGAEVLFDARTPQPRLNTHYLAVFEDFERVLAGAPDNRALSRAIHEQLLI